MIAGVEVKRLKKNVDDRGYLMEILRRDDPIFFKFGQVYVSLNYPGVVRAWHWHEYQDDFFCCVRGMVQVALHDLRQDSPTCGETGTFFLGDDAPALLRIPVGVAHGYKTLGTAPSLLLNVVTRPYDRDDPDEQRIPWDDAGIGYDWGVKFR